jgi:hypothetical protein
VKALYEIPLCVSLVFVMLQTLRVSASALLDCVIRNTQNSPKNAGNRRSFSRSTAITFLTGRHPIDPFDFSSLPPQSFPPPV